MRRMKSVRGCTIAESESLRSLSCGGRSFIFVLARRVASTCAELDGFLFMSMPSKRFSCDLERAFRVKPPLEASTEALLVGETVVLMLEGFDGVLMCALDGDFSFTTDPFRRSTGTLDGVAVGVAVEVESPSGCLMTIFMFLFKSGCERTRFGLCPARASEPKDWKLLEIFEIGGGRGVYLHQAHRQRSRRRRLR